MRIRPSLILAAVSALAGLAATSVVAGPKPAPAKPAAPMCGCHVSHAASHHVRRHAVRTHVRAVRHGGHGWRRVAEGGGQHMWGDQHSWHDEHGWSDEHHWSEGDGHWGYGWQQRPWATDKFGYLTWPGKTHFMGGHTGDGGMGPPPMDDSMSPPPPPPPPPPGWRDGPSGPQDGESYDIYRF